MLQWAHSGRVGGWLRSRRTSPRGRGLGAPHDAGSGAESGTVAGGEVAVPARFRVSSLLAVHNLTTRFTGREPLTAVNDVSFALAQGRVLVVLGESGSGKSVLLRSILRLLPPSGTKRQRRGRFQGHDLLGAARGGDAGRARQPHRDGVPGAAHRARPGVHRRRPDRRDAAPPRAPVRAPRRAARTIELLRHGRASRGAARRELPVRAERRHAPARGDRPGAGLPARACCSPTSRRPRST